MKSKKSYFVEGTHNFQKSSNIVQDTDIRKVSGSLCFNKLYKSLEDLYCRRFLQMSVYHHNSSLERRVTEVATHPSKPLVVCGTKNGGMIASDISEKVKELFCWDGKGPGHSILDIKFPYHLDNRMLTAGLDCTVKLWDLELFRDEPLSTLLETGEYKKWYCSVTPSPDGLTVCGSNTGSLVVLDKNFKPTTSLKVHKNKVNSIDFNRSCPHIFATASLDKTIKLFDIRKLVATGLETIEHAKALNTAVFSKRNGQRLMVSDQHSGINIYQGPLWKLERSIVHPHRQFQHLTPIRASWHPCLDLIVIGRYPDDKLDTFQHGDLKSIDIFSAETGNLKAELVPSFFKPIITSIAEFDYTGEILITGTGSAVLFWHFVSKIEDSRSATNHKRQDEESSEESYFDQFKGSRCKKKLKKK